MSWIQAHAWVVVLAVAVLAGPLVGAAGYRLGTRRAAGDDAADRQQRWKDRALFAAALAAGATVYGAVVIGSYNGLVGFAQDTLGWHDWRRTIPAVSLDGTAASFAFLAFRAVMRQQSPWRCYLMVWGATGGSAAFNFQHGDATGGTSAGAYLGFLSVVGVLMFHTFLDQLSAAGETYYRRKYPPFGLRWVTAAASTFAAALAWINYPPEGVEPTVPAALAHLEEVREAKRRRREQRRERREARRREAITARAERAVLAERARSDARRRADGGDPTPGEPVEPAVESVADGVVEPAQAARETDSGVPPVPAAASSRSSRPVYERPTRATSTATATVTPPVLSSGRRDRPAPVRARAGAATAVAPRLDVDVDDGEGTGSWGYGRVRMEHLLAERVPAARVPLVGEGERLPVEFAAVVGELADVAGLTRKAALKVARSWALRQHASRRLRSVPHRGR